MLYLKLRCAASFTSVPLVASVGGGVIERAPDVNGLGFDRSTGFAGSEGRASTVRIEPFPRMPSYLAPCFRQDAHYQLLVQAARVRSTDTAVTAIWVEDQEEHRLPRRRTTSRNPLPAPRG